MPDPNATDEAAKLYVISGCMVVSSGGLCGRIWQGRPRGYRADDSLVRIEALPPTRQAILDYFVRNGYVIVVKYLRADQKNLYFTPVPETKTTAVPSS